MFLHINLAEQRFFVFHFGWLVSKESSLESWAPGHVVIAEGSNEVDSSQKSLRQAKAFDSSKEKDTRERSVMGQEKSARERESTSLLVFLLPSLRIIAPWINFWPSFLSFFLLLLHWWSAAPILPHHQLSTEMWSKWQFRAFTLLQSSSFTI